MRDTHHDSGDSWDISAWMQEFAAKPVEGPALPDSRVLWWKGQALQRLDREREAVALLDLGEHIQTGSGVVAALALLVWTVQAAPGIWALPSLVLASAVSVAILSIAAAATIWDARRVSKA